MKSHLCSSSVERLQEIYSTGERLEHELILAFERCRIRLRTNSAEALARLRAYFNEWVVGGRGPSSIEIVLVDRPAPLIDADWKLWPLSPTRGGPREWTADYLDGRLIREECSGMMFLLRFEKVMAVGPCLENLNRIVNLVNDQYIAWNLHRGWELCHAAGIRHGESGIALAGVPGAGKSTLALKLLGRGAAFVSNDRLLVNREGPARMTGVPKYPRLHPGKLPGDRKRQILASPDPTESQSRLAAADLWRLEEDYDLHLANDYGPGRFTRTCELSALIVLTWDGRDPRPPVFEWTNLWRSPELLEPLKKLPGPSFHDGRRYDHRRSTLELASIPYTQALGEVLILHISGGVDFAEAADRCIDLLRL